MSLLHDLVETSGRVGETRARREKIALIADCLGRTDPGEVEAAVAYLSGEMRQGRIGIGYRAIAEVVPASAAGAPRLTVRQVDERFAAIAAMSGTGSKTRRLEALADLLSHATAPEQRFLRRLLIGEVRQGALEGIMMDAVARAADVPAAEVRRAVMLQGDVASVAAAALGEGRAGLAKFALELMRPIQPMLAGTAEGIADAIERIDRAALEWKIDGARIQVHRDGEDVRVFTRRLNDVTAAVPEIVEAVRRLPAGRLVLDGEAIALRPDGRPQPFQVTMRRFGRRLDVERMRAELPIVPWFFDCLHVDGRDLIDRPAEERLDAVDRVLPADLIVPRLVTADPGAQSFLEDALARGHEGVMAKSLAATYEAGRRGAGWLKVKPTHTLDLVVLAAEWGSGRRRGRLSNLHLGARDEASGGFVMLGKTFKGLTDALLEWQTKRLQEIEVERDAYTVYVKPILVVEIAFDGVQASPQYPGGVALRFARVRQYRPDKPAAEADTLATVRAIHEGHRPAQ